MGGVSVPVQGQCAKTGPDLRPSRQGTIKKIRIQSSGFLSFFIFLLLWEATSGSAQGAQNAGASLCASVCAYVCAFMHYLCLCVPVSVCMCV